MMKFPVLCITLLLFADIISGQGPVYISQETPVKIAGAGLINFGGETSSGDLYGVYLVGQQVVFGIYQVGSNHFQASTTDAANAVNAFLDPSVSISSFNDSTSAQELVWIVSSTRVQTAVGAGSVGGLTVTRSPQLVADATTRIPAVVACSQSGNRLCAVGWTGINPPPGLNDIQEGNENVATNISGSFVKPPAISGGIPNAYANSPPVMVFRGTRLYMGYVGTDNSSSFNILWSDDYQTFSKATTGIQGVMASLGVQGTKLVVAWADGGKALHIGYWNGDPSGPLTWQAIITRHTAAGDQVVHGGRPTLAQYRSGLILCWEDSSNGISTGVVTLP